MDEIVSEEICNRCGNGEENDIFCRKCGTTFRREEDFNILNQRIVVLEAELELYKTGKFTIWQDKRISALEAALGKAIKALERIKSEAPRGCFMDEPEINNCPRKEMEEAIESARKVLEGK